MLNPFTIAERLITLWQDIPDLVEACGDDAEKIFLYRDSTPGNMNLFSALLEQPDGSVMLSFDGVGPGRQGTSLVWGFTFTAHLKPLAESGAEPDGLVTMIDALVNGVSEDTGRKWRDDDLVAGAYLTGVPSFNRRQFVVGSDTGSYRTVDYWAGTFVVNQVGDD